MMWIGITMIAAVFICLFAYMAHDIGIRTAVWIFVWTFVLVAWIFVATTFIAWKG